MSGAVAVCAAKQCHWRVQHGRPCRTLGVLHRKTPGHRDDRMDVQFGPKRMVVVVLTRH